MSDNNYVSFEILGVNSNYSGNSFAFTKDAECEVSNDQFIRKIVVSANINYVTFYLHNSLQITDEKTSQIVNYLSLYLESMMVSVLKNSSKYSTVSLKPTIRRSTVHFLGINKVELNENIEFSESMTIQHKFGNEKDILNKWIQDVSVPNYESKIDKYNILFLLLQGKNIVQNYMAMYAYLMTLVRTIYSKPKEEQKQVVDYITNNCSRVKIKLVLSPSTRPGAKATDTEDQFTALRNKIGHPTFTNKCIHMGIKDVNELASIICCAIDDIP